jgi:hypothetical protein
MKLNARIARCLCRLQDPEFEPLLDFLRAARDDEHAMMEVAADEAQLRRGQGRARLLGELLTEIDRARETLKKLEDR